MVIFNGEYDDKPSNEPSNVEGLWGSSPKFSGAIFQLQVVGHSGQPLALASRLATKGCFFRGAIGTQEKPMKVELTHDSY